MRVLVLQQLLPEDLLYSLKCLQPSKQKEDGSTALTMSKQLLWNQLKHEYLAMPIDNHHSQAKITIHHSHHSPLDR